MNPAITQAIRTTIRSCTSCELSSRCNGAVPWSGPIPARIAVLGEAPGSEEDRWVEPFVGPSGKLLKRILGEVGFDVDQIAFVNTVSCYPGRTPTWTDIANCAKVRDTQLELIKPQYLLNVGKIAVSARRGQASIFEVRGEWWRNEWGWETCTFHPAAVLRNMELLDQFRSDIEVFRVVSFGVFDPPSEQLVQCSDEDCESTTRVWRGGKGLCWECGVKRDERRELEAKYRGVGKRGNLVKKSRVQEERMF